MGCDIHPAIEVSYFGKWHFRAIPTDHRNYSFFSMLAGVRNYEPVTPCAPNRGMPEDAAEITRDHILYGDQGGHSASWCTLAEFKAFREQITNQLNQPMRDWVLAYWDDWAEMAEHCKNGAYEPATDDDVRFVFDFDN